jgi:hypothetical protein
MAVAKSTSAQQRERLQTDQCPTKPARVHAREVFHEAGVRDVPVRRIEAHE